MPEEYEPAVSQKRQEGLDKQNIAKISPVRELFVWKQYVQFCFTSIDWYCYYVPTSYIRIQNCLYCIPQLLESTRLEWGS